MKALEIQAGKCYTNGKGWVRKVKRIYCGYFQMMVSVKNITPGVNEYPNITLSQFAAWAKSEAPCGGSDE